MEPAPSNIHAWTQWAAAESSSSVTGGDEAPAPQANPFPPSAKSSQCAWGESSDLDLDAALPPIVANDNNFMATHSTNVFGEGLKSPATGHYTPAPPAHTTPRPPPAHEPLRGICRAAHELTPSAVAAPPSATSAYGDATVGTQWAPHRMLVFSPTGQAYLYTRSALPAHHTPLGSASPNATVARVATAVAPGGGRAMRVGTSALGGGDGGGGTPIPPEATQEKPFYAADTQIRWSIEMEVGKTIAGRVVSYASSIAAYGVGVRLGKVVHPIHGLAITLLALILVVAARAESQTVRSTGATKFMRVVASILQNGVELLAGTALSGVLSSVFPPLPSRVPIAVWAVALPIETTIAGALLLVLLQRG